MTATNAQTVPVLAPDANGGVYFAWVDASSGYDTDIRGVRWNTSGVPASGWTAGGDLITNVTCQKYAPCAVSDGAGAALFAWGDNRCVGFQQIYAIRVAAAGGSALGWTTNGVRLAPTSANQFTPAIASDGAGGAFVAWQDARGVDADIYLQHVDGNGAPVAGWPATGFALAIAPGVQSAPVACADGAGGVFVAWQDARAGTNDIYIQRVTGAGALAGGWPANGLAACAAPGEQRAPTMDADGAGGVVLAWQDQRAGNWDIFAERMLASGALAAGWAANGLAVCAASGDQTAPRAIRDGANGVVVAWQDHRGPDWDVYALRVASTGAVVAGWPSNGLALAAVAGDQTAPVLAGDGAAGLYFAWEDRRAGTADIDAVRLNGDGGTTPGWTTGGTPVCGAAGDQTGPQVAVTSDGSAVVVWSDTRNAATSPDLYAQHLLSSGPEPVRPSGLAALHHDGQTFLTWTPPSGTGWTHRVYYSPTAIATDADLNTAMLIAGVGDSSATDARLSALTHTLYTFRPDSALAPLAPDKGLFVVTAPVSRFSFYAVTSQLAGGPEDRHVVPGGNSLAVPVHESLALPRPVFQRQITLGVTADVYTLWTWSVDTPFFPAMSNRPGWPYDCGVTHGAPGGPAFVRPHERGGNFTGQFVVSNVPSEWVLSLDDYTLNDDVQTYWYGYHTGYDFTSNANLAPISGRVVDYTVRRIVHTIQWYRRTFDFDTARCYAFGYSLGATCSIYLGLTHPELVVAAMGSVPKLDFSFLGDLNPDSGFNPGQPYRLSLSRLWGSVDMNLPASQDSRVYTEVNDDSLAARAARRGTAYLVTFSGRNDETTGWAEKLGFYAAIERSRVGGAIFWDMRDHAGSVIPGAFGPMTDPQYLYRFRSDLSWPAFSHCSLDGDPGDGHMASGDSLGTLNGYMDWDPAVIDQPDQWQAKLLTRALSTRWGTLPAPESLTVDVTPRRLQRLDPAPGSSLTWAAFRSSDGAQVQSGTVIVDSFNRITVPSVKVYRTGTTVVLVLPAPTAVPGGPPQAARLTFAPPPNPAGRLVTLALDWPTAGRARLELFDTSGRRIRVLLDGDAMAGPWHCDVDLAGLAPGVYLARADAGAQHATRRLVVLR